MMRAAGMTSAELLVAVALGLFGLTAATTLLAMTLPAWSRVAAGVDARLAASETIDQLVRDVRLAGYDPRARGIRGVLTCGPTSVDLQSDLDGDGAINANSEERVSYRRAASGDGLLRVVGAQAMPILSGLARDGFRLRYYDGDGRELDPADPRTPDVTREVTVELALERTRVHPGFRLTGGARVLNP